MPEAEYTALMRAPIQRIWEYAKDMNNWAPHMLGYQGHEIVSDTESIWTLKGDVGILSRVVQLRVQITEWNGPERVRFTLEGLDEPLTGEGALLMHNDAVAPVKLSWWRRLMNAFMRTLLGMKQAPQISNAESRLTFKLKVDAGGPTGPLINAMIAPVLLPTAEHLAGKIAHAVEC